MFKFYVAWFVIALFYLYQYILRVAPGVMVEELRREFLMNAEEFSTLGAYYLYAYSLCQIPLGLVVDRLGTRRTVSFSILLCIVGTGLFASCHTLWLLQVSRVLVGLGSAAAFMCALKVAVDLLPPGSRGQLMGATLTLGTVGAFTASTPLVLAMDVFGWRGSFYALAGVGVGLILLVQGFVPPRTGHPQHGATPGHPQHPQHGATPGHPQHGATSIKGLVRDVAQVLRNPQVMLFGVLAIGVYTPLSVLADLWGTAFLVEKYALPRAEAAQMCMMMYLGLAVGSLVLPWVCEAYGLLNRGVQACSLVLLAGFVGLIYGAPVPLGVLSCLLVVIGFCCGAEMICFTGAARSTSAHNSGVTLGVVNTLNMLGGAVLQQGIGAILDYRWSGDLDEYGIRIYSVEDFSVALSLLVGVIALCAFLSFLARSTPGTEQP